MFRRTLLSSLCCLFCVFALDASAEAGSYGIGSRAGSIGQSSTASQSGWVGSRPFSRPWGRRRCGYVRRCHHGVGCTMVWTCR